MIILLALLVGACAAQDWELVWSDEFNGTEIDPNNWQHEITFWGGGVRKFSVCNN